MLRIITLNLNGIRSAWRKGFLPWARTHNPDIICLQEIKAHAADLCEAMQAPEGFHAYYRCAEKKGYSGVGLWCRHRPERLFDELGSDEFDREGRYLRADFGNLSIISLYQPSGSSSEQRQAAKFRFMALIYPHLVELASSGRDIIVGGDWRARHHRRRRLEYRPSGNRPL